jgi:hypothetical protein
MRARCRNSTMFSDSWYVGVTTSVRIGTGIYLAPPVSGGLSQWHFR